MAFSLLKKAARATASGFRHKWVRRVMIALALVGAGLAIWFGFVMTGLDLLASPWLRGGVIALLYAVVGLVWFLRWRKRRKKAQALEDSLFSAPASDSKVLNERMQEAMAKLRKSGGRNYLYDLPWYVIIGPPGAGKTTALANSGIEFPGQDGLADHARGFGGTRNCDWWFAEDAVLIDTAGRYTTQDSDRQADQASWKAFLDLLKKGRPDQPVNGVMLAFSVEDVMNATEDSLQAHAETVRARLAELHETLRIDVPVYAIFTKADLISGFREYFGSFSQSRRKLVWGHTFQTRDRKAATHEEVPAAFDALLTRLSDEVVDRMTEEPDPASRIAIFGLPGQMEMLRDKMAEFLRLVFEPTRYKSAAILRGFYFTSGTQEGTPVDQVLGAMARDSQSEGFRPAFMSGKGKSYFLHDLLRKVIFAERDWVGFDRKAVRRRQILHTGGLALISVVTLLGMAGFGYAFWKSADQLRAAQVDASDYADTAREELSKTVISDDDPAPVLPELQRLRDMRAGYADKTAPPLIENMGLSRWSELHQAANRAYSDGLERMLRPRLVLYLENTIPQLIADGNTAGVYRALKVYLLLGGQGPAKSSDMAAVESYFDDLWSARYSAPGETRIHDQLMGHLQAMLQLDGDRTDLIGIDNAIVTKARDAIVNLPLAEQAYASIKDRAISSGQTAFGLADAIGGQVDQVLTTNDGTDLHQLVVPGLYTFEGYWGFFLDELTNARARLEEDRWVLGDAADRVDYQRQLGSLSRDLHRMYRQQFDAAWNNVLSRLALQRMSADPPRYDKLAVAGSSVNSPLLRLVEEVDRQTRLSRLYDKLDTLSPEQAAQMAAGGGDLGAALGDTAFNQIYAGSGVFQRVVMDQLRASSTGKSQTRAQSAGGASATDDSQRAQVERISGDFAIWHRLLDGEQGGRAIDVVLSNLQALRENRRNASLAPTPADETMLRQQLATLTMNNSALPKPLATMLNGVEREFSSVAQDATVSQLNRALNDDVGAFCREFIAPYFPFAQNGRHVSPAIFGQFFGPGGRMDRYFTTYLQPYVSRGENGLEPAPDNALGQRLSPALLRSFSQAEAIRMAFFASGSSEPEVSMSITHVSSSPSVQLAVLTMNGKQLRTQPNSTAAEMVWPGQSSGVNLSLYPQSEGGNSALNFNDGRWDIVSFLRNGVVKINGNVANVAEQVGGRSITYRFEFDSTTVPFLMPELSEFTCPVSVE
ncbi:MULTISPECIES: type VI secretion system membrane subunit TssM [Thioclava]|uniref:Type VI secretion system membrane subunit TssM n=1 Tax=Thioclava litoralis TaxID=3076557 RepID=A0ABZ1E5B4_9RHOB|nr:type VI secretion system membrane subunit TssM [Thioclava sp. FTW29]